jgi:hypothetical protein
MPQRASKQTVSAAVGRMLFRGKTDKQVAKKLAGVNQDKLSAALKKRGLGEVKKDELSKVLSGKSKTGWSMTKLRQAVEAMQDVGIARKARTAQQMVLTASREAQKVEGGARILTPEQLKARFRALAVERREEANGEEKASGPGILERMRTTAGGKNVIAAGRMRAEGNGKGIEELRQTLRETRTNRVPLAPKFHLPKDQKPEDFQP